MCWTKKKDYFCPRCRSVVSRETRDEICPPNSPCGKRNQRPLEVLYKRTPAEKPCESCRNGDNPNASRVASTHQGNTNRYVSPQGMPSNRVQTINSNYLAPPQDHHRNPAASSSRNAGGGGSGRAQASSRQFVADQAGERGSARTAHHATGARSNQNQIPERGASQSASRRTACGGGGGANGAPPRPSPVVIERGSSSSASRRTATGGGGGGGGQLELFNPRNQGYHGSGSARSGTSTQRYVIAGNGQLVPVNEARRGGTVVASQHESRRGGTVVPSSSSSSSCRHAAPHVSGTVHSGSSSSGAPRVQINIQINCGSGNPSKR
ncbi:hypothetical protein RBB50_009973 [Rhinocladiella similis]